MQQNSRIAVAGATGRVGRHVVDVLEVDAATTWCPSRARMASTWSPARGWTRRSPASRRSSTSRRGRRPTSSAATRVLHGRHPATCRRPATGPACGGWWWRPSSASTAFDGRLQRRQARAGAGARSRDRSRRGSCARRSSTSSWSSSMGWGTQGDVSYVPSDAHAAGGRADGRRGARWRSPPASARRASTRRRPRRSPARARSVSWRRPRMLAERRGDGLRDRGDERPLRPGQRPLRERRRCCRGPGAKLAGPTFEEWLDAVMPAVLGGSVS